MGQQEREEVDLTRIVVRPIATPLPMGFCGLAVASLLFAALQLGWVPAEQGRVVALGALLVTVPLQAVASVWGFLARDPVAGTGMAVLGATWAFAGVVTLTSPPGSTSAGLGIGLCAAAAALLVPASAALTKVVAAAVIATSSLRFALTGVYEITAATGWKAAAGAVGLLLFVLALYAALAFELEGSQHRTVLPLLRRGSGEQALSGSVEEQLGPVRHEAGVRTQL